MRVWIAILINIASVRANAQQSFLMYTRTDGHYHVKDSATEYRNEPIFFADCIFTIEESIGFSREINILTDKTEKKKKWAVTITDNSISINGKEGKITGRILTTTVDPKIFYDSLFRFLLIPIKCGVPITRLKGKYFGTSINDKWTIIFSNTIDEGKSKGLQITEILDQTKNVTNEYPLTKYTTKAYGHLVYLGGINKILVPVFNDSDSKILFDSFPAQFQEPNLQLNTSLQLVKQ